MPIYPSFVLEKEYGPKWQECIKDTVKNLVNSRTDVSNPGLLLGNVQSGKTRTFIGIIALSFDSGFDNCIVFTKGTKALAQQTYHRLDSEFRSFIETDEVKAYDIMNLPPQLTSFIRKQKIILIVKKQIRNLNRLVDFFNDYPDLVTKKTLIIDDEADYAGVGFKKDKSKKEEISMNVLATKLNSIRAGFKNNYGFLQVTATPYSLYLQQRGEFKLNDAVFEPIRPVFTTIVPTHDKYIGGKQYFEDSENPDSIFSHLYVQVPKKEVDILGKRDQRYINNILKSTNLQVFRQSIIGYIVGGSIRIIQNKEENKNYKSSFIIHIATGKGKHQWQIELVEALVKELTDLAKTNEISNWVKKVYENFIPSIKKNGDVPPEFKDVLTYVKKALIQGEIGLIKINSEEQTAALLDRNGQLRLDNPFNIFVGGYVLDRGLTIDNLIGFFYGRNPSQFQQDTVLQHHRMYGARSMKDISVTRFYTVDRIYKAMSTMHKIDSALREAFMRRVNNTQEDDSVVFIESDNNGRIKPCAPNKILLTSAVALTQFSRFLPIGFQTKDNRFIKSIIAKISKIVDGFSQKKTNETFLLPAERACEILDLIHATFEYNERYENLGYEWDVQIDKAIINRLANETVNPKLKGYVYCHVGRNRNVGRKKHGNGTAFTDAPDTGSGETSFTIAKNIAKEIPCLILLLQKGKILKGWRNAEFWWPVIVAPANTKTAVFAGKIPPFGRRGKI